MFDPGKGIFAPFTSSVNQLLSQKLKLGKITKIKKCHAKILQWIVSTSNAFNFCIN